uniref:restriction endonuclease subunit S n=1 Tax=Cloacibacterium sp. TaxID=1913682 RepID=UPI0035AEA00D
SSILSNTGIYSKSREIILENFEIIGIAELGSNTFMATGTNTVTLFLRRRNNYDSINLKIAVEKFFANHLEVTLNCVDKPVSKFINHVWENISIEVYISILKKEPNNVITQQEIYKEYQKKIKSKNDKEFWTKLLETEKEKLFYFILAYPQKVVLVKSGEKDAEKRFLGYEFSNRRGSEGIHPIQRGKNIEDCTQLFDADIFDNPTKASTYIYKAFARDYDFPIDEAMQNNVSRHNLVDMLTFDRVDFEKNISLSVKKKVKIESKWELKKLRDFKDKLEFINGHAFKSSDLKPLKTSDKEIEVLKIGNIETEKFTTNFEKCEYHTFKNYDSKLVNEGDLAIALTGATVGKAGWVTKQSLLNQRVLAIRGEKEFLKYISTFIFGKLFYEYSQTIAHGNAQGNLSPDQVKDFQIPLPPIDIQQKIVSEIEVLEANEKKAKEEAEKYNLEIQSKINNCFSEHPLELLGNVCYSTEYGSSSKSEKKGLVPVIRMGNIQNGKILLDDLVYSNNVEENKKYLLKYNDVLFNRTNSPELVGKAGIYQSNEPAIFAGYLIRINYKEDIVLPVYLNYVLNSETIRNYGFSVMSKSVNQANINGTILKTYKIPLPPLSEQQKLVSEIEKIEEKIKTLETEISEIPKHKEVILKKYL